ncbi:stage V sporulation protein D [Alloiococcus sp. CFN-8]|uniref:stage V sporulation protein D n=1 Tax=Alloiococcus sp. CFN-8 TaxID=3416081 RepID=UPI003CF9110D
MALKKTKEAIRKNYILVMLGLAILLFSVLGGRLVYLMIVKGNEYGAMASEQWTNRLIINGKRGRILDTNYNELAISGDVYRIDLDLSAIDAFIINNNLNDKKEKIDKNIIANQLAEALQIDPSQILEKLNLKDENGAAATYAVLQRKVEKDKADAVKELKISGVVISNDTVRYYPNNSFLSHVMGVTGNDGEGLTGLEYLYNNILEGTPGARLVEMGMNKQSLPYTTVQYTKPINGKDLVLTIDENIQYYAEKAAEKAFEENKAKAVTIIVMNPNNGEILALVNKPDYDANNPRNGANSYDELQQRWRNRAVSDTFEPGSIFKVITAITAMEQGVVNDSSTFTCSGSTVIDGQTIRCWKTEGHGSQSFSDIIKNSCNMGFIQLANLIGKEKLQEYITLFGFGKETGIDLPGEATGIIKPLEDMADSDLATISFGHTNTLNTIQYMAALNSIANGGTWITPHILKEIVHTDDNETLIVDSVFDNIRKEQIIKESNASVLRSHLERVVTEGSSSTTYIEGYRIAGKTGTAQKVINGHYGDGKYISSFAGMAPSDNPQITLMVTIDEPSNGEYYASQVAAPYAKMVFNDIFNYISISPEGSLESIAKNIQKEVVIPDLRGIPAEDAIEAFRKEGLNYEAEGSGNYIMDISPKPGYSVKEGTEINIYLGDGSDYNKDVVVPDLRGYSKQSALELLNKLNLQGNFSGEGMVSEQSINPNEFVKRGTSIDIILKYVIGD